MSDAQNSILVLVREMDVMTVTEILHVGCSELHSRACSGDGCDDSYRELAPRMLRIPFSCLFRRWM